MQNPNPQVYEVKKISRAGWENMNEEITDEIDSLEIFETIRHILDPEHPLTLEQLKVLRLEHIWVEGNLVTIEFTPTVTHCNMSTLIGLSIRVKLLRSIPKRFKVDIRVAKGTHESEDAVNKQLADKERVAAALENSKLLGLVDNCIKHTD